MEKIRILSGWPETIKADCDYFNITFKDIAKYAYISRYKVSIIANTKRTENMSKCFLKDLDKLTRSFKRIIAERKKPLQNGFEW